MTPAAVVLCGGESRRMGRPKAWLPFGPEVMLQRVVRLVTTVAQPIIVVAAPGQDLPELPREVAIVRDEISGRGPLEGLVAGLTALDDQVELVYATGTDVPFLEPRWITRLADLMGDADLAIPRIGDYFHPLAALYRKRAVLPAIEELLHHDRLRHSLLVEAVKTRVVLEHEMRVVDPELRTLRNLNHPEEYERAHPRSTIERMRAPYLEQVGQLVHQMDLHSSYRRVTQACSAFVAVAGIAAIVGWMTGQSRLAESCAELHTDGPQHLAGVHRPESRTHRRGQRPARWPPGRRAVGRAGWLSRRAEVGRVRRRPGICCR